ncbi:hypothetical protein DESC_140015 [Desulfosarcina cetonica]|nr:hypothetical protein DESC_140015 [Desulfosarcina cetonica]
MPIVHRQHLIEMIGAMSGKLIKHIKQQNKGISRLSRFSCESRSKNPQPTTSRLEL